MGLFSKRSQGSSTVATAEPPPAAPLRWIDLDAPDVGENSTVVDDIFARRLDGITVASVLSETEAARAVERLEAFRDQTIPAMFGYMLGLPLAELNRLADDPEDHTIYLDEAERAAARYRDAFGFDPAQRVSEVVSPLAGGRPVRPPTELGRSYNAGNIRWYEPGSAGLPAHAGNEFQLHSDASHRHLRATTVTHDHISWFVILQAPESGGALSVFDLLYGEHRPAQEVWNERGRTDSDFDDRAALKVAPRAGTLVLFGGGWRWHRVDRITGTRQRITYGGFAGPSTDGESLHLWF